MPEPATARERRFVLRVLGAVLLVTVLGQRFVLPVGGLAVGVPLVAAYTGLGVLLASGAARHHRMRTELYLLSAMAVVVATWAGLWQGGGPSATSLMLLLVLYLPWAFCLTGPFSGLAGDLAGRFVRLMLVAAGAAVVQVGSQLTGVWTYTDLLARRVPAEWLAAGYNVSIPVEYGSPIHKANAVVFLEPSFLSQFCALALVVALLGRAPAWQPLLLGLGMAATLSGTGILLLAVGLVLVAGRSPRLIRPSAVAVGAVGVAALLLSPAGALLLDRSSETSERGSSGYLRFVQPYTEVAAGLAAEPVRYLVGAGPGAADRLLESGRNSGGEAVVYPIAPKLAFEYGLPAATVVVALIVVSVLRGAPDPALGGCVLVMLFLLSGSLLQPHTVALGWLLTSLWGRPAGRGAVEAVAARRRGRVLGRAEGAASPA